MHSHKVGVKFMFSSFLHSFIAFVICFEFLAIGTSSCTSYAAEEQRWWIRRDHWTSRDEQHYSEFVAQLGESNCRSFDQCLKNSANPYRQSDPKTVRFFSDCADLPFLLRTYFSWKNGLPFSYVNEVAPVEGGSDIRYTPKGNRVKARADIITPSPDKIPNAIKVLQTISNDVSSAMFRFNPALDNATLFTDFYPTTLDRESIRPGSIIYDPNGHVAVVYKIENDGRVLYMDAHPDNSITRGTYGKKFARANPGMGAGFKNWRPLRLVNARLDDEGHWIGGRMASVINREIKDFSDEQFYGNQPSPTKEWKKGLFVFEGKVIDYYDFIRQRLARAGFRYEPLTELKNMLEALCQDLHDRADAVEVAVQNQISLAPHPIRLPTNIYGTSGDWETYSTPSRDARIKTSFLELKEKVAQFLELNKQQSPDLDYSGTDLKSDLLDTYEETIQSCQIRYTKSDQSTRVLTFDEIYHRLFQLSFDPYHCPERRWGETNSSELIACSDNDVKKEWYEGEQFMRNQIERTYDVRMDFTVEQLFTPQKGNGVMTPPDIDFLRLLKTP